MASEFPPPSSLSKSTRPVVTFLAFSDNSEFLEPKKGARKAAKAPELNSAVSRAAIDELDNKDGICVYIEAKPGQGALKISLTQEEAKFLQLPNSSFQATQQFANGTGITNSGRNLNLIPPIPGKTTQLTTIRSRFTAELSSAWAEYQRVPTTRFKHSVAKSRKSGVSTSDGSADEKRFYMTSKVSTVLTLVVRTKNTDLNLRNLYNLLRDRFKSEFDRKMVDLRTPPEQLISILQRLKNRPILIILDGLVDSELTTQLLECLRAAKGNASLLIASTEPPPAVDGFPILHLKLKFTDKEGRECIESLANTGGPLERGYFLSSDSLAWDRLFAASGNNPLLLQFAYRQYMADMRDMRRLEANMADPIRTSMECLPAINQRRLLQLAIFPPETLIDKTVVIYSQMVWNDHESTKNREATLVALNHWNFITTKGDYFMVSDYVHTELAKLVKTDLRLDHQTLIDTLYRLLEPGPPEYTIPLSVVLHYVAEQSKHSWEGLVPIKQIHYTLQCYAIQNLAYHLTQAPKLDMSKVIYLFGSLDRLKFRIKADHKQVRFLVEDINQILLAGLSAKLWPKGHPIINELRTLIKALQFARASPFGLPDVLKRAFYRFPDRDQPAKTSRDTLMPFDGLDWKKFNPSLPFDDSSQSMPLPITPSDQYKARCVATYGDPRKGIELTLVGGSDGRIQVIDLSTNTQLAPFDLYDGKVEVRHLVVRKVYGEDRWEVVSYSTDRILRLWNGPDRRELAKVQTKVDVSSLVIWQNPATPTKWKAFFGCYNGKVCAWNGSSDKLEFLYNFHKGAVSCLALWTPPASSLDKGDDVWMLVFGTYSGQIFVLDGASRKVTSSMSPLPPDSTESVEIVSLTLMNFSKTGWKVIAGCDNGMVYVFDLMSSSPLDQPKSAEQVIELKNLTPLGQPVKDKKPVIQAPQITAPSSPAKPGAATAAPANPPSPPPRFPSSGTAAMFHAGALKSIEKQADGSLRIGTIVFFPDERNRLGEGSLGTFVYKGFFVSPVSRDPKGRPCAVKVMNKAKWKEFTSTSGGDFKEQLEREFYNLEILWNDYPTPPTSIIRYFSMEEDAEHLYVAIELCDKNLKKMIEEDLGWRRDPETWQMKAMREIINAVSFLHSRGFVHNDITPLNILYSKAANSFKLSDFGTSKQVKNSDGLFTFSRGQQVAGTGGFHPREILIHAHNTKTKKVDIFSLGCVLYYILSGGVKPWNSERPDAEISIGNPPTLIGLTATQYDLIEKMLKHDPNHRPDISAVARHPMFWTPQYTMDYFHSLSNAIHTSKAIKSKEQMEHDLVGNDRVDFPSWDVALGSQFWNFVCQRSTYSPTSAIDLIRAIRNVSEHWDEVELKKWDLQNVVGSPPQKVIFVGTITRLFPKLLIKAYALERKIKAQSK